MNPEQAFGNAFGKVSFKNLPQKVSVAPTLLSVIPPLAYIPFATACKIYQQHPYQ